MTDVGRDLRLPLAESAMVASVDIEGAMRHASETTARTDPSRMTDGMSSASTMVQAALIELGRARDAIANEYRAYMGLEPRGDWRARAAHVNDYRVLILTSMLSGNAFVSPVESESQELAKATGGLTANG